MINLEKISRGGLFWLTLCHWIIYTSLTVIAPCMVIINTYNLVGNIEGTKTSIISGMGISILIAFLFIGLKLLKTQANKIPIDSYMWKARIKALINLAFCIVVPIIILVLVFLINDNMELALYCIKKCVWLVMLGLIEDCILGSSVERENMLMDAAKTKKEIDKRRSKV